MKCLITESQLNNVIYKYLDSQDFYIDNYKNGYLFFESNNPGPILIATYPNDYGYINSDLLVEVSKFFSLELNVTLNIIGEWIKTKIDFDVTHFYSDYGAD